MKFVGLSGLAGVGKDVTAELIKEIAEEEGKKVCIYSFGAPVYQLGEALVNESLSNRKSKECSRIFTVTQENVENMCFVYNKYRLDKYKDFPDAWGIFSDVILAPYKCYSWANRSNTLFGLNISPRKILQIVGTEFGRGLLNDKVWIDIVEDNISITNPDLVVLSDVRFTDEVAFVKDNSGIIVNVTSGDTTFSYSTDTANHISAKQLPLDLVDYQLHNLKEGKEKYKSDLRKLYEITIGRI